MKLKSQRIIDTHERGSLNCWQILSRSLFGVPKKRYLFDFEIEVEGDLRVDDEVIAYNHLTLNVVAKTSKSNFVLRTKELRKDPPFIGEDIIVVSRLFNKSDI